MYTRATLIGCLDPPGGPCSRKMPRVDPPILPAVDALPGRAEPPEAAGQASVAAFEVVVVAASLGGPEAVRELVGGLPAWFPSAVLVVQHRTPAAQDVTVNLLRRSTPLRVELVREQDRPTPGIVHV